MDMEFLDKSTTSIDIGCIQNLEHDDRLSEEVKHSQKIVDDDKHDQPEVGMTFVNLSEAWEFWKKYAESMGFGVRKHYHNRSKKDGVITNAVYVCCKEGKRVEDKRRIDSVHRWEIRSQCQVMVNLTFDRKSLTYKIKKFVDQHNHELEPPETRHMLRSYREVSESYALAIDLASDAGLTPKATHELLCKEAGGRSKLGFIMQDHMSYLKTKRQKNMAYGELGCIVKYLEEQKVKDPRFFYSMQFDKDELVTNIFWVDSRMMVDYIDFGDVVTFDTTYGTNKELRPLGAFVGFNHHRKMVIFGGALLYDETSDSFSWLFETFLKAHGGKIPQTVFTDQDSAMTKALQNVWPSTRHGLCTWHLNQNGIKHLGWQMKEGATFLTDFRKCMFEYGEEAQFEEEWDKMLEKYGLRDNDWLVRTYSVKEKWARCYMKYAFTLGIRSTQLSESLNSDLKDYLKCDLNITDFFKNFDRVLDQKREKVLEAEFKARQRVPLVQFRDSPLLRQASQRYTPPIFELFQIQLRCALMVIIKTKEVNQVPLEYSVCLHDSKEKEFKVIYDPTNELISCSCRKFERMGLLCCHALKVFIIHDIMEIPEKYILPRWTREFKSAHFLSKECQDTGEDTSVWIKRIQSQLLRLTLQASTHGATKRVVENLVNECGKEVFEFSTQNSIVNKENDVGKENIAARVDEAIGNLKGLKKKEGLKRTRRPKPLHEINRAKTKKSKSKTVQSNRVTVTSQHGVDMHPNQTFSTLPSQWPNVIHDPNVSLQYTNISRNDQCFSLMNQPHLDGPYEVRMALQNQRLPYYGPSYGSLFNLVDRTSR